MVLGGFQLKYTEQWHCNFIPFHLISFNSSHISKHGGIVIENYSFCMYIFLKRTNAAL